MELKEDKGYGDTKHGDGRWHMEIGNKESIVLLIGSRCQQVLKVQP